MPTFTANMLTMFDLHKHPYWMTAMKHTLPAFLILSKALVCLGQPSHSQPTASNTVYRTNVGDIIPDSTLDDATFLLCNEKSVPQYYGVETSYRGGAKAIREAVMPQIKPVSEAQGQSGWVTIRFVVNCRGETGRFRSFPIDKAYQPCVFPSALTEQLLAAVKSLHDWQPGSYNGVVYDSYYYLCFKIVNGELKDILP